MAPHPNLVSLLRQAGFSGEGLRTAWAIAMRESGGDPGAFNGNANTGDKSYGLFQINMLGSLGPARMKQFGLNSESDLFNPVVNAKIAYQMSRGGTDFGAWGVGPHAYKKTPPLQYLNQFPGDPGGQQLPQLGGPAVGPDQAAPQQQGPQSTGNSYIDLVNKLESMYTGLGEQLMPHLPPLGKTSDDATQNIAERVSGNFGAFSRTVKGEPSLRFTQPVQPTEDLRTILNSQSQNPKLAPPDAGFPEPPSPANAHLPPDLGPEGNPTNGWKYPAMTTGGKAQFSSLTMAAHTDWQHVDTSLLQRLNQLGHALGVRVQIISGYRAPGYSASVGGYSNDPHTRGVAVDAYINGVPIGDYKGAFEMLKKLGLESGAQPGFYRGKRDPEHVQIPGSGVNKSIHASRTYGSSKGKSGGKR